MVAAYAQSPSENRRYGAPKVFGILSIIFASITLLFGFIGLIGALGGGSLMSSMRIGGHEVAAAEHLRQTMSTFYTTAAIQPAIYVVFSAVLLGIGIGQLGYKRWAQKWSVLWGWGALGAIVLMSVVSFVILSPLSDELAALARSLPDTSGSRFEFDGAGFGTFLGMGATMVTVFFMAPYPILLVAFFNGRKCRDAMTN